MQYASLGNRGPTVSTVGFAAWAIGGYGTRHLGGARPSWRLPGAHGVDPASYARTPTPLDGRFMIPHCLKHTRLHARAR